MTVTLTATRVGVYTVKLKPRHEIKRCTRCGREHAGRNAWCNDCRGGDLWFVLRQSNPDLPMPYHGTGDPETCPHGRHSYVDRDGLRYRVCKRCDVWTVIGLAGKKAPRGRSAKCASS